MPLDHIVDKIDNVMQSYFEKKMISDNIWEYVNKYVSIKMEASNERITLKINGTISELVSIMIVTHLGHFRHFQRYNELSSSYEYLVSLEHNQDYYSNPDKALEVVLPFLKEKIESIIKSREEANAYFKGLANKNI